MFSYDYSITLFVQDKGIMMEEVETKADDSDYYTPEDPHTTILSPVKSPSATPIEKVSCHKMIRSK
jgi:hypothetical protein